GSVACAGASTPNITRHDVTNAMPIFFKRMDPPMSWTRYVRLQLKPYVEFTAFILISGGNSSANAKDHASQRCGCERYDVKDDECVVVMTCGDVAYKSQTSQSDREIWLVDVAARPTRFTGLGRCYGQDQWRVDL